MNLLYKFLKIDNGNYLEGPKKGEKIPDTYVWVHTKRRGVYYVFTYEINELKVLKVHTQPLKERVFKAKNVYPIKTNNVPRLLLHVIIRWCFSKLLVTKV